LGDGEPRAGRPVVAVVLAAGKGTRMESDLAKVLHQAAGRPLLAWVLDAARVAGCSRLAVVIGHQAATVREAFSGPGERGDDVDWVLQERQLGTGHALLQAAGLCDEGDLPDDALLLVLSGDVPLVRPGTLRALVEAAAGPEGDGWGAMAVAELDAPGSLGRVFRRPDAPELLDRIVEAKDATPEELENGTVNAGIYALPASIFPYLRRLGTDNAQGELYLTDALGAVADDGHPVRLVPLADPEEGFGVNTREELARVDRLLRDR
jgi:bifunctional UDP-N-acetylglucosamine pyrophosphorylase / glucosamine-1-phosphate N-acetyltransferase